MMKRGQKRQKGDILEGKRETSNMSEEGDLGGPTKRMRFITLSCSSDNSNKAKTSVKGIKRPHLDSEECFPKKKRRRAIPLKSSESGTKRRYNNTCSEEQPPQKKNRGEISGGDSVCPSSSIKGASLTLDDFTFYRELGEGSYGKVMLARCSASCKWLAVKSVKKMVLLEEDVDNIMVERRVIEIASGCPFLIHSYATFQTQCNLYFVMEYLAGGDLFHLLNKNGPLDPLTTTFLAAEIVCGIKFLHNKGIIHRDLKPENILINSDGHVKIRDFGLALETMSCDQEVTGYAGTQGYIAPEMLKGKKYNSAVDWYSFGVILYNMVTGKFPARSPSSRKLKFPNSVNGNAKDLIIKLLNSDPVRRQSVAATICSHPFFSSINWEELKKGHIQPPFSVLPQEKTELYVAEESPFSYMELLEPPSQNDQKRFHGFSFLGSDL